MPLRGEAGGGAGSDPTAPILIGCAALLLAGVGAGAAVLLLRAPTPAPAPPPITVMPVSTPAPVPVPVPVPEAPPVAPVGPVITPDSVPAEGAIAPEVIRRVVRGHLRDIQRCYEDALSRAPAIGTVRVTSHFTIAADGSVSEATVDGSDDTVLTTCIAASIRRWVFPTPSGGGVVTVNYPFVLQSEE